MEKIRKARIGRIKPNDWGYMYIGLRVYGIIEGKKNVDLQQRLACLYPDQLD